MSDVTATFRAPSGQAVLRRLRVAAVLLAIVALNAAIGLAAAGNEQKIAILVALLPVILGALVLIIKKRDWLVVAALLLATVGGTLNGRVSGTGGTAIFPSDIFALLAIGGYIMERLTAPRGATRRKLRTVMLSWPLAIFAIAIWIGIYRGHERYGTAYLSQPARMIIYAAIGLAMADMEPARIYRQIVRVFYLMSVVEAFVGAYNLATGHSQTSTSELSTGGTRALALTTAMFLAAALVLALLNLELSWERKGRGLHFLIAALALFGIVISLGRTTFVALGALVPILFIALRHLRRTFLAYAPIIAVLATGCILIVTQLDPSLGATIGKRFTGRVGTDVAVNERQRKYAAAMEGFGREPVLGLGFGRPVSYLSLDNSVHTFSGDPEDSYIYVLAGGGIVAFSALLLLLLSFFVDAIRRVRHAVAEERALIIFGASLAFILAVNALSGPIFSDPGLMLMMWIAMLLPAVVRPAVDG